MANPRKVYFLFNHRIKIRRRGSQQSQTVEVPILSRALESTGLALNLTLATEEQLRTTREEVVYYKRGSAYADRILVVYVERAQGEERKIRTLHLPVPTYAPTYKVLPIIRQANTSGVLAGKIIGVKRHGFLWPIASPGQGGQGG